jgi:WD40 repeat protein
MPAEWFYAVSGVQRGPISFEELQDRAKSGEFGPADLVWTAGLAEWVPASSQPGLFGTAAPTSVPTRRPDPILPSTTAPDDEFAAPRRRPTSSGSGLKIALFGGAAALVVIVIFCGILGVVLYANKDPNVRSWNLKSGSHIYWTIAFHQGDKVQITVQSNHDSDIDLFVFSSRANMDIFVRSANYEAVASKLCVAFDNGPDKDCKVEFTAQATQDYFVMVANRKSMDQPQRNRSNSGKLVFYPPPR